MEKIEVVQREAMTLLYEYSDKIIEGTKQVIHEMREDRKNDTDELFNLVIQGINWEIELFNNCEAIINKKEVLVDKSKMAEAVGKLGKVLQEKDDIKIAACLDVDFLPFLIAMQKASKEI